MEPIKVYSRSEAELAVASEGIVIVESNEDDDTVFDAMRGEESVTYDYSFEKLVRYILRKIHLVSAPIDQNIVVVTNENGEYEIYSYEV